MTFTQVLAVVAFSINLVAFYIIGSDKRKSEAKGTVERIPEGLLFFMAAAFGAVGVLAGMYIFRHKTRKWYFQIGIPLLILQNMATLYVFLTFLQEITL